MRSSGPSLVGAAIASGFALLAVVASLLLPSHETREPAEAPPARVAEAPAPASSTPSAEEAPTVARVEAPEEETGSDGDAGARLEQAAERSITTLVRDLADPNWSRATWDAEVGALAASLPDGASEWLARRFCERAADGTVLIVVAELLRARGAEGAALRSAEGVALLRAAALARDSFSSSSQAAARALAWLAEEADVTQLTDLLTRPGFDERRPALSWALRAAPAELVVPALLRQLRGRAGEARDDRSVEMALITLDEALQRRSGGSWPLDVAADAVTTLERLLAEPKLDERTRLRALATGATLAAQGDGSRGAALLRACVDDAGTPVELRLRAAELLLRLPPELAPVERRHALDHLVAVARDGKTAHDRRRAWSALAAAPSDSIGADLAALAALADVEPDAAVRAVAAGTLARLR